MKGIFEFIFLLDPAKRQGTGSMPGQPVSDARSAGSGVHCTSALEDTDIPDAISSGLLWPGRVSPAFLSHQPHVGNLGCINEQPLKPPTPSPEPFPPVPWGTPRPQLLSCRQRTLHLHCCLPSALPQPSSPLPCLSPALASHQAGSCLWQDERMEAGHRSPQSTGMTQARLCRR